jgi:hypothetical protein
MTKREYIPDFTNCGKRGKTQVHEKLFSMATEVSGAQMR